MHIFAHIDYLVLDSVRGFAGHSKARMKSRVLYLETIFPSVTVGLLLLAHSPVSFLFSVIEYNIKILPMMTNSYFNLFVLPHPLLPAQHR